MTCCCFFTYSTYVHIFFPYTWSRKKENIFALMPRSWKEPFESKLDTWERTNVVVLLFSTCVQWGFCLWWASERNGRMNCLSPYNLPMYNLSTYSVWGSLWRNKYMFCGCIPNEFNEMQISFIKLWQSSHKIKLIENISLISGWSSCKLVRTLCQKLFTVLKSTLKLPGLMIFSRFVNSLAFQHRLQYWRSKWLFPTCPCLLFVIKLLFLSCSLRFI